MREGAVMTDALTPGTEEILLGQTALVAALDALGAEHALAGAAGLCVTGAALDSRVVKPGEIFFALPGAHVHGARFVAPALAAGAVLAVVARRDRELVDARADRTRIAWVEDAGAALTALGRAARAQARDLTVIAVTGSYGKTTTKEMIAAVLAASGPVHRTPGNFNNHLGVPVTLLGLTRRHRTAVIELGMNAPGEIAALAALAAPQVGVLTGVGRAHLAGLGSRAAIMAAKLELASALGPEGRLILPADDPELLQAARTTGAHLLTVGVTPGSTADLRATAIEVGAAGVCFLADGCGLDGLRIELAVPARVLVTNALLALAAGHLLGAPAPAMAAALASMRLPARRLNIVHAGGLVVVDDCYNANPESMAAALATLGDLAARRRIAVLGDMRELGAATPAAHAELGTRAAAVVDRLYVIGEEAETVARAARAAGLAAAAITVAPDRDALIAGVTADLQAGDSILVKASRALGLEVVVAAILAAPLARGGAPRRAGG